MERIRDPEGIEVKQLVNAGQFAGKDVLEVGCGYGWLTWQFAAFANRVFAIDPNSSDIHEARDNQSISITNVNLIQANCETLPFPSVAFDVSLFSSSL